MYWCSNIKCDSQLSKIFQKTPLRRINLHSGFFLNLFCIKYYTVARFFIMLFIYIIFFYSHSLKYRFLFIKFICEKNVITKINFLFCSTMYNSCVYVYFNSIVKMNKKMHYIMYDKGY